MQAPQPNHVILLGSSARAATASAIAAGLQVTAVDSFGDVDLREMCQRYQPLSSTAFPLAFLRSQKRSTLVPLGGCERWIDSITSLQNHHRIAGATADQWKLAGELSALREIADAAAICFPESSPVAAPSTGRQATGGRLSTRWLLKTPGTCGGLGVRRSEKAPIATGSYYQRWVKGISIGASYLATEGDVHLLGVCRGLKFRTPSHPAIYGGSFGPLHLASEWTAKLVRLGEATVDRFQLRGLFNADLIWHPVEGFFLLEINPRYTASMELLEPNREGSIRTDAVEGRKATQASSLLAAHLQCFSEAPARDLRLGVPMLPAADPMKTISCKRVIFARQKITMNGDVRRELEATLAAHSARWADIPAEGTTISSQCPFFSIFTEGGSPSTAIRRAARLVRALQRVCER